MSQLAGNQKARIVFEDKVVFFEKNKENHWVLYTKVFAGDGDLPNSVRSCVSSGGVLRWQENGAYLKLDAASHSVYLFEEIEIEEGKYIPFKHHLSDFSTVAAEWIEILQELADRDSSLSPCQSGHWKSKQIFE
jgi:hypothetical protein